MLALMGMEPTVPEHTTVNRRTARMVSAGFSSDVRCWPPSRNDSRRTVVGFTILNRMSHQARPNFVGVA
ncbi:MAG: hypothetical protein ACLGJC_13905 [Alphaproteobacteria bacterium]